MAGVSKKMRYVVKPAEATWNGILPLSELDQVGAITHGTLVYIFNGSPSATNTSRSQQALVARLQESLSRALVPFYPLAGRLRWVGEGSSSQRQQRLELDCNGSGAELIVAESTRRIAEFGDFYSCGHQSMLFQEILPEVDYKKQRIHELPIVMVQLTRFGCGGIGLGIMISHVIADGQASFHFIREWARLSRLGGGGCEPLIVEALPCIDRQILIQASNYNNNNNNNNNDNNNNNSIVEDVEAFTHLPVLIGEVSSSKESSKETISTILPLTKKQVDRLKKVANNVDYYISSSSNGQGGGPRPFSRFEVIAAHIWRCASKARRHDPQQHTTLCFCVDFRHRLNPPLSSRYFGNGVLDVLTFNKAGELISRPLSHACNKIREANEKVNDEYVCSVMDYFKTQQSLSKYYQDDVDDDNASCFANPNLNIVSWLSLPMQDADFGWGKEVFSGPGRHGCDGDVVLLPSYKRDGSVLVDVCLQVAHMDEFKKYLYQDIEEVALVSKI